MSVDQFHHRLARAEDAARRLETNPAPTVPKYDVNVAQNFFAHLLHGPTYQIRNNSLVNGKVITVDFSHVPNLVYLEIHAMIAKGIRFPSGAIDDTPWDDLPFGMSIGQGGGGPNPGSFPHTLASGTDPASSPSALRPLQSEWRITHGIHTTQAGSLADPIGGVRSYASIVNLPQTQLIITTPPDLNDSNNCEIVPSFVPSANCIFWNWGQGTTDYEVLSGGIWTWLLGDTPVPGNGLTMEDFLSHTNYDWLKIIETKVMMNPGYSWVQPIAEDIKAAYSGVLNFTIGSGSPSGLSHPVIDDAICFFVYCITTEPLDSTIDANFYPLSIVDNGGGSPANRLVGRWSSSAISDSLSLAVPVNFLPGI